MAGDAGTELSRGGMVTKIEAGKIAVAAGTNMIVALGKRDHPLAALSQGAPCTVFVAHSTPLAARKRWIAGRLDAAGVLVIDDGAVAALKSGRSLLPAGVVDVEGIFERGDTVTIEDRQGNVVGRGLSAYSSGDARLLIGRKSREIERILGYRGRDEMIHRDDMALSAGARDGENAEPVAGPKAGET